MTNQLRADLKQIANLIDSGSRVLDVGSGDGSLLEYLKKEKNVKGRGIEIKQNRVNACLSKGLAVIQGNAEEELPEYPDKSFDYVILSRTLPATQNPVKMIRQMLRIAPCGIISMPNFGYWRVRLHLLLKGTMPVTASLDNPWYETENIHLCTVKDFVKLAKEMSIIIERCYGITGQSIHIFDQQNYFMNLLSDEVIFVIKDRL